MQHKLLVIPLFGLAEHTVHAAVIQQCPVGRYNGNKSNNVSENKHEANSKQNRGSLKAVTAGYRPIIENSLTF